jgi:pimeloyl-ACP methyl ester carboxylesterase
VHKVALLDSLPTLHIWENTSRKWALDSWHWALMPLDNGLPELMMGAIPPEVFMEKKISKKGIGMSIFDPEALAEYVRCFNAKTIKGSCADYRATATVDLELDRASRDRGLMIACPVLLLWGAKSHTEGVFTDVIEIWRKFATDIVGEGLDSGHYVNEHRPNETLAWFRRFFVDPWTVVGLQGSGRWQEWEAMRQDLLSSTDTRPSPIVEGPMSCSSFRYAGSNPAHDGRTHVRRAESCSRIDAQS